ncbi:MAG: hypothetical protein JO257_08320 [Deltaproteobacteria bacterium]|nr:hypothetical protein [Deltaproteobacteria bacterium]
MPAFVPAPPPTLTIGHADAVAITRAALAIHGRHATLTLVLSTATRERRDIALPISVPHGAAVTGLVVVEQSHRTVATAQPAVHAREEYMGIVAHEIDPVMLTHDNSSRDQEHLALHVFPLAKAAPVTVEIWMELPDAPTLVVEPEDQTLARLEVTTGGAPRVFKKLRGPAELELPSSDSVAEPAMSVVNEDTALFAMPVLEAPARDATGPAGLRSAADIRAGMRTAITALAACAEQDPLPRTMSFVIAPDGTVGDVAGVDACFADAVKTAHFAAARESTVIRYPLSWDVAVH